MIAIETNSEMQLRILKKKKKKKDSYRVFSLVQTCVRSVAWTSFHSCYLVGRYSQICYIIENPVASYPGFAVQVH